MVFFLSFFLFFFHFFVSNALLRAVQGVPFITLWILKAWRFRVGIIQFITRLENARVINFRMHGNKNVTFILHGVSENQIYETLEKGNKNLKDSTSAGRRKNSNLERYILLLIYTNKSFLDTINGENVWHISNMSFDFFSFFNFSYSYSHQFGECPINIKQKQSHLLSYFISIVFAVVLIFDLKKEINIKNKMTQLN